MQRRPFGTVHGLWPAAAVHGHGHFARRGRGVCACLRPGWRCVLRSSSLVHTHALLPLVQHQPSRALFTNLPQHLGDAQSKRNLSTRSPLPPHTQRLYAHGGAELLAGLVDGLVQYDAVPLSAEADAHAAEAYKVLFNITGRLSRFSDRPAKDPTPEELQTFRRCDCLSLVLPFFRDATCAVFAQLVSISCDASYVIARPLRLTWARSCTRYLRIVESVRTLVLGIMDKCGDFGSAALAQAMTLLFNTPPGEEDALVHSMHLPLPSLLCSVSKSMSRLCPRVSLLPRDRFCCRCACPSLSRACVVFGTHPRGLGVETICKDLEFGRKDGHLYTFSSSLSLCRQG